MLKITEIKLRKIIRQEILREAEDSATAAKGEKTATSGALNTKALSVSLKMDEPTLKTAIAAAKKGDASKGAALLAFVKALLSASPEDTKKVGVLMSKIEEK